MYNQYTADDYKKNFGLNSAYALDGFLIFGGYEKKNYQLLKDSLSKIGVKAQCKNMEEEFLNNIMEIKVNGKNYWFTIAYGGALLSEYLHLACLFGSKKNILIGNCGGLKKGAKTHEIIIPTWSFAEESSAKAYQPHSKDKHYSDKELSDALQKKLEKEYTVYREPTITYQAMLAETWDDVQKWSAEGYAGVEMEASTVFAVSQHYRVPSAAILQIADNMIEEETLINVGFEMLKESRGKIFNRIYEISLKELLNSK